MIATGFCSKRCRQGPYTTVKLPSSSKGKRLTVPQVESEDGFVPAAELITAKWMLIVLHERFITRLSHISTAPALWYWTTPGISPWSCGQITYDQHQKRWNKGTGFIFLISVKCYTFAYSCSFLACDNYYPLPSFIKEAACFRCVLTIMYFYIRYVHCY